MNKVFSINDSVIMNGAEMKAGDFGIIRKKLNDNGMLDINNHVIKTFDYLVCLQNGGLSDMPKYYEIEIKNQLNLQRIKK